MVYVKQMLETLVKIFINFDIMAVEPLLQICLFQDILNLWHAQRTDAHMLTVFLTTEWN